MGNNSLLKDLGVVLTPKLTTGKCLQYCLRCWNHYWIEGQLDMSVYTGTLISVIKGNSVVLLLLLQKKKKVYCCQHCLSRGQSCRVISHMCVYIYDKIWTWYVSRRESHTLMSESGLLHSSDLHTLAIAAHLLLDQ